MNQTKETPDKSHIIESKTDIKPESHVWIRPVKRGVANRFTYAGWDEIEVHQDLFSYPILLDKILSHELKHEPGKPTFKDLKLDLNDGIKKDGLMSFIIARPSTWIQIVPVWYNKDHGLVVDINMSIMWGIILAATAGIFYGLIKLVGLLL